MKTEVACRNPDVEKSNDKPSTENTCVKGLRRTLQPLQSSAIEKENLVSGGTPTQMSSTRTKIASASEKKVNNNKKGKAKKTVEVKKKVSVTVQDLTSEGEPSESYWKILAEKRRVALEEALKENETLHAKIELLEEENAQCKVLLDQTKELVQTLTEMLNENEEDVEDDEVGK